MSMAVACCGHWKIGIELVGGCWKFALLPWRDSDGNDLDHCDDETNLSWHNCWALVQVVLFWLTGGALCFSPRGELG